MEQPIVQAQLELLCVRAKRTPSRSYRTHTAEITLKKRHTPHKYWTFLRRSTAICLSAVLLTATPEPNAILPDLIFQSEVDGFPAIYSAIDLPTVSLADTLAAQAESHTESAPPEVVQTPPPIRLDTGHDQPSNSRSEVGFLSRLSDQVEEEKIQTLTIAPTSDYGYDAHAGIRVLNGSGKTLNLPELLNESLTLAPVDNEPQVLIYHTHACEAYTPSELDSYTTDENDRCSDTAYNVVRIGAEMAEILRTEGITVIHETTLFDGKAYNGAYARSLAAVEAILQKYPSIEVVIDVHRDALNQPDAQKYKLISELDGVPCAQLMLVMGTDAAAGDHPLWEENLKLALHMQEALLARSPTLARPIKLTRSSYNQFTAPGAMILEVGANGNSLTEAIRSGQAFAKALAEILLAIG